MIGQAFGFLWEPPDAGASVAGAGLLGAGSAWLLSLAGPRQVQVRVWGGIWPLVGIALTIRRDQHGPPLLVGFALGALLLWLKRRRHAAPPAGPRGAPATPQPGAHDHAAGFGVVTPIALYRPPGGPLALAAAARRIGGHPLLRRVRG